MTRLLAAVWGWLAFWRRPDFDVETWPIVPLPSVEADIRARLFTALSGGPRVWPAETVTEVLIAALQDERDTWQNRARAALGASELVCKDNDKLRREAHVVRTSLLAASDDPDAADVSTGMLAATLSGKYQALRETVVKAAKRPRRRTKKT